MESTIPKLLKKIAAEYPDLPAQMHKDADEEFQVTTFSQLYRDVKQFAAGLKNHGVVRGDRVGLIADNRKEWFVTDLALHCLGAADVPRGCDSNADEISYILSFSQCRLAVLENARQLEKVIEKKKDLKDLKQIIIMDSDFDTSSTDTGPFKVVGFDTVLKAGEGKTEPIDAEIDLGESDDIATLIYTSGTTGEPKGVMLSHKNFLHQVEHVPDLIMVGPGDRWLSVLPVWHSFERIMQYVALGTASTLCYSKPVGSILLADMQKVRPTWMASVPRIWESVRDGVYRNVNKAGGVKKALFLFFVAVGSTWKTSANLVMGLVPRYRKRIRALDFLLGILPFLLLYPLKALGSVLVFKTIKEKLGGRFVAGISGGGGLPAHVDAFFQAAGILLLEGYGLTESAPVLSLRPQKRPIPGTIGPAFPGTEIKIIGEDGSELGPNKRGVLLARGPQIMKGYYRKDELTAQAIDADGFLNTGDLAVKTHDGEYAIVGRAKDTIVLLGGENIEPSPIEEKLKLSPYISTAVVLGQDRKFLTALILPDIDNVLTWAKDNAVPYADEESLLTGVEVHELLAGEISGLISSKNGFKIFERIVRFTVLPNSFEIGQELSAKQEIKRHVINEIYAKDIKALYS
ncbi:MAG: AMP-binding protein [Spirochaetaceae bacterium]|nr:AMP-binding protein [Spirochaetaceae bacterium]MDT8298571.1 AMP-binding protein [Spirochaetaceae bacterium]